MKIYSAKLSDPGMSGKNNEDNCIISTFTLNDGDDAYFAVVADGIGGHNAGELASKIAVDKAQNEFSASDVADPQAAFRRIINEVNLAIYERAQGNPQFNGMGTTLALTLVANGELYAAGIGDSRVYRLTKEGKPIQVTLDHTWAQEAIDAKRLTPEQARRHPNRNVLKRYLGILPDVEVDDKVLRAPQPFREGDALVVCSDGLTDLVEGAEIQKIVGEYNAEGAAAQLIQLANQRGGHDNITAIVLKTTMNGAGPEAIPPPSQKSSPQRALVIAVMALLVLVVFGLIGYILVAQQNVLSGQQVNANSPTMTQLPPTAVPTNENNPTDTPSITEVVPIVNGNVTSTLVPTSTTIPTDTPTPIPPTRTRTRTATFTLTPTLTPTEAATPTQERQGGGNNGGGNNGGGNNNGGEPPLPKPTNCPIGPSGPSC